MVNIRLLIQIPFLLLGSCVPVSPPNNTSIVIYSGSDGRPPEVRQYDVNPVDDKVTAKKSIVKDVTCEKMALAVLETYKIPELPDLSNIDADDNKAVVSALLDHIKMLRTELRRVMKDYKCTLEKTP
jgi:hypothetical protein